MQKQPESVFRNVTDSAYQVLLQGASILGLGSYEEFKEIEPIEEAPVERTVTTVTSKGKGGKKGKKN